MPHAVGESARGEAAGGGGGRCSKPSSRAQTCCQVRSPMHGVSRLPVSWTPRSDPRSRHSSTRHFGAQASPWRHSEQGNSTENGTCSPPDALRGHWRPTRHLLLAKSHTTSEKSHSGRVPINRHVDRQTDEQTAQHRVDRQTSPRRVRFPYHRWRRRTPHLPSPLRLGSPHSPGAPSRPAYLWVGSRDTLTPRGSEAPRSELSGGSLTGPVMSRDSGKPSGSPSGKAGFSP